MSSQRKECLPCQVLYEVRKKSLSDFALWKALVTCQSNFSGDEYRGEACRGWWAERQIRRFFKERYCSLETI